MSDLISRTDAICEIDKYIDKFDCIDENFLDGLKTTKKILNDLPYAKTELPKGRWIRHFTGLIFKREWGRCSECGNILDFNGVNAGRGDANFCPKCGADMRKETKGETHD